MNGSQPLERKKVMTAYKKQALKAAKELHYGIEIINRIKETDDDFEIARIMINARRALVDTLRLE